MPRKIPHIIICIALILCLVPSVSALTVSPAKVEVIGDPGQTLSGEIELFNEQQEQRTFFFSAENFEPRGDSGAPYFIGADDGLATWISTTDEVTLASNERRAVPYTISIPEGTSPGGYFAAIFFGSQPPKSQADGAVTISGKIGVLILLRVSGEVLEQGGISNLTTVNGSRLFTQVPIDFQYHVSNGGGDRIVPRGDLVIRNTFRMKTETIPANVREGSVLPNSSRKFDVRWDERNPASQDQKGFFGAALRQLKNFHIGWYTAILDLSWGGTNQAAAASYHFFIIPWQLLILLSLLFIIIRYGMRTALRGYRRKIMREMNSNRTNG